MGVNIKDWELYRKLFSRDNLIEIAIIQYFNNRSRYNIKLMEYENGSQSNYLKIDQDSEVAKSKLMEITKPISPTWERKSASEKDFEKLENCFDCVDSNKCMGCDIFTLYVNNELIT